MKPIRIGTCAVQVAIPVTKPLWPAAVLQVMLATCTLSLAVPETVQVGIEVLVMEVLIVNVGGVVSFEALTACRVMVII